MINPTIISKVALSIITIILYIILRINLVANSEHKIFYLVTAAKFQSL